MKTQRGFTLLELLVTLAILGVVSAMTFPAFSSWIAKRRLSADFEALQALTQQLQTQAQAQAGTAALVCSSGTARITAQVSRVNAATPCQGLGTAFSPGNVISNLTEGLPNWQQVQVTPCDDRRLVFHADGSVCKEGGGSAVIQLGYLNDPGMSKGAYRLSLSQPTGFPTRERYDPVTRLWQPLD